LSTGRLTVAVVVALSVLALGLCGCGESSSKDRTGPGGKVTTTHSTTDTASGKRNDSGPSHHGAHQGHPATVKVIRGADVGHPATVKVIPKSKGAKREQREILQRFRESVGQ
jgi:hypothetical protein